MESFISHPTVRPSILAKQHSAVYDFLLNNKKEKCEACMILDIPDKHKKETAEYFCYRICNGDFQNIRFSFDGVDSISRIIINGDATEVLRLVNGYMQERSFSQPFD